MNKPQCYVYVMKHPLTKEVVSIGVSKRLNYLRHFWKSPSRMKLSKKSKFLLELKEQGLGPDIEYIPFESIELARFKASDMRAAAAGTIFTKRESVIGRWKSLVEPIEDLLKIDNELTNEQLAEKTQGSLSMIKYTIKKMKESGRLECSYRFMVTNGNFIKVRRIHLCNTKK